MKKILSLLVLILILSFTFSTNQFIEVSGTEFRLNNEIWRPLGVNYYASYHNTSHPSKHWLYEPNFNPSPVRTEFAHIKNMGFNTVTIQPAGVHKYVSCNPINSVLDIAKENDLKVILFLPNCDAVRGHITNAKWGGQLDARFDYTNCYNTITSCNLSNREEIFSYMLTVESASHDHETTGPYFRAFWTDWLKERYETISNARTNLGYNLQIENGYVKVPTKDQICDGTGSEIKFVSAYRRFFDDYGNKEFAKATLKIKELDPNHLISAKNGLNLLWAEGCKNNPVDPRTGAHVFDYIGPEYYRETDEIYYKAGFTTQYSSMNNKKPVVFLEFGKDSIQYGELDQKNYFENLYQSIQDDGAQGSVAWWYITKNGVREDERDGTDYGIINYSDRSEKQVVSIIRNKANIMTNPLPERTINSWVLFDKDAIANRLQNQSQKAEEYKTKLDAGRTPTVITPCTNTDSKQPYRDGWPTYDSSIKCVGNTTKNANCPLKCLNSQFDLLQIKNSLGQWENAEDNSTILVRENAPIYVKAIIANIEEGKWLNENSANGVNGSVSLVNSKWTTNSDSNTPYFRIDILANIDFLESWKVSETKLLNGFKGIKKIDFSLNSRGIAQFGEKIQNVTLRTVPSQKPICNQFTERFTNTEWTTHKLNWRKGTHTILEILRRAKLWKYCN
jgi:hypothetical protein